MFGEYVYDHSPALYSDFILINDSEGLNSRTDYINAFAVHGFEIVEYKDDLSFRIEYEKNLKCGKGKIAVLNEKKAYEYLICDAGTSLDVSGEQVMTHGGMTIDEVVVPFIKIKAEKTHG